MAQVLIANSLANGFVVFLTGDNTWSPDIAAAAVAEDDSAAEALLQQAKVAEADDRIVDPYLVKVTVNGAGPEPVEYREYIRAFGPSMPLPAEPHDP